MEYEIQEGNEKSSGHGGRQLPIVCTEESHPTPQIRVYTLETSKMQELYMESLSTQVLFRSLYICSLLKINFTTTHFLIYVCNMYTYILNYMRSISTCVLWQCLYHLRSRPLKIMPLFWWINLTCPQEISNFINYMYRY